MKLSLLNKIFGKLELRKTDFRIMVTYYHPLPLLKNKNLEIYFSLFHSLTDLFRLVFGYSLKGDHHGLTMELSVLWFEIELNMYDGRHWNWKENRYYLPGDEQDD